MPLPFFGWHTPDPLQKAVSRQSLGLVHVVPQAPFSHA
jgi:hypothetical protein